jgi:hypothetical protein
MPPFIFTCPNTDLKVQHWLDDDDDTLTALFFIDRKTRKLFGDNEE